MATAALAPSKAGMQYTMAWMVTFSNVRFQFGHCIFIELGLAIRTFAVAKFYHPIA